MIKEKSIIVNDVSKKYTLYKSQKERLYDLVSPKSFGEDFYALSNVNFIAEKGDIIGFIGINGSGKSTLSNIIAGIVPPTNGKVKISGAVSIIAVSAGLKGDLTGRENIELKCLMLGFSRKEIELLEPEIIKFSELGAFIDQPVKTYSSGMKSRLGFAISVNIDPDILIIDEALSVGDKAFAEKSLNKMIEFKKRGKTMIFVSHSLGQMKQFCEKILWLEFGKVKDFGEINEILPKYESFLGKWKEMSEEEKEMYREYRGSDEYNKAELLLDTEEYIVEKVPISRMCKFKEGKEIKVFENPEFATDYHVIKEVTDSSFFAKQIFKMGHERFYLISEKPSSLEGVIGWVNAKDVTSHLLILIDEDQKRFYLKGKGIGYKKPWGGKEDIIIKNFIDKKNEEIVVTRTEKLGNNLWYQALLGSNKFWIHHDHISLEKLI